MLSIPETISCIDRDVNLSMYGLPYSNRFIYVDNVSISVENRKWFKKLTDSSGIMLSDFLDDIYKAIKKDKGRVCQSLSQMDYDENYIRFDVLESKNPMRNKSIKIIISFLLGNRHSWKGYTIKYYFINSNIIKIHK